MGDFQGRLVCLRGSENPADVPDFYTLASNYSTMKKIILLFFLAGIVQACSEKQGPYSTTATDSVPTVKKELSEELPPPSDIRQFKWFYSGFVKLISFQADTLLNKLIYPAYGLNIIESKGAMPVITNVKDFAAFKTLGKKAFYDFDAQILVCDLKEEELPKIDCNAKDYYTKSGCFTREVNTLKDSKIWEFSNLSKSQTDLLLQSVQTITRTVVVTANYTYYFSLIKGGWWLTFVDMRKPCQA